MSYSSWAPERPSPLPITPSSTGFRRPLPPSAKNHAPVTTSPLSPFSTTPPQAMASLFHPALPKTPRQPAFPSSHYYRAPRSALTSPCRSNYSSPSTSPTRNSRRSRIQSLLATDPLLSRLTPMTIMEMANDSELGFSSEERAWSLRAADGLIKIGDWLREVEAWTLAWGRGKNGEGYLPPEPGKRRRKKGEHRKMSLRLEDESAMRTIAEEDEPESPLRSRGAPASPSPLGSSSGSPIFGDTPRTNRAGKPLTPMQLKMQKRAAVAMAENGGKPVAHQRQGSPRSTPSDLSTNLNGSHPPATPQKQQRQFQPEPEDDEDDEYEEVDDDDDEAYYGSLPRSTIERYEARIEEITEEVEDLDVEGLKGKVLSYRTGIDNPLTSSSAVITAITLQLLPPLHRLMKMLSLWAVRLAVLKIVPVFLRWLDNAKQGLDAGYETIRLPAIVNGTQKLDEEVFAVMAENIQQRVTVVGQIMDSMLDALEGREDVLPDKWIGMLEDIEEGVSTWEMDAERVVLEGRLQEVSKAEEYRAEMEKMQLVMESERVAEEACKDVGVIENVLEKVGETERGLMEALEAQEDVQEGIEIEGQMDATDDDPDETVGLGLDKSLLKRLREVQCSEIEADRGRRWNHRSRGNSIGDGFPSTPGMDSFSLISPIASPGLDMERRKSEAEHAAENEQRSFFSAAFGERLRSPMGSPTIIVQGFDIPPSPRGISPKECSPGHSPRLPVLEEVLEKQPGDKPAPVAISLFPLKTSQQLQHVISEGSSPEPVYHEVASSPVPSALASEPAITPSPDSKEEEEEVEPRPDGLGQESNSEGKVEEGGDLFMTPPLGAGELPAVVLKQELPSTPDSTRPGSKQGSVEVDSQVDGPGEREVENEAVFPVLSPVLSTATVEVGVLESESREAGRTTPDKEATTIEDAPQPLQETPAATKTAPRPVEEMETLEKIATQEEVVLNSGSKQVEHSPVAADVPSPVDKPMPKQAIDSKPMKSPEPIELPPAAVDIAEGIVPLQAALLAIVKPPAQNAETAGADEVGPTSEQTAEEEFVTTQAEEVATVGPGIVVDTTDQIEPAPVAPIKGLRETVPEEPRLQPKAEVATEVVLDITPEHIEPSPILMERVQEYVPMRPEITAPREAEATSSGLVELSPVAVEEFPSQPEIENKAGEDIEVVPEVTVNIENSGDADAGEAEEHEDDDVELEEVQQLYQAVMLSPVPEAVESSDGEEDISAISSKEPDIDMSAVRVGEGKVSAVINRDKGAPAIIYATESDQDDEVSQEAAAVLKPGIDDPENIEYENDEAAPAQSQAKIADDSIIEKEPSVDNVVDACDELAVIGDEGKGVAVISSPAKIIEADEEPPTLKTRDARARSEAVCKIAGVEVEDSGTACELMNGTTPATHQPVPQIEQAIEPNTRIIPPTLPEAHRASLETNTAAAKEPAKGVTTTAQPAATETVEGYRGEETVTPATAAEPVTTTAVISKVQAMMNGFERPMLRKSYSVTALSSTRAEPQPPQVSRVQAARMMFENFASKPKDAVVLPRSMSTPELVPTYPLVRRTTVSGTSSPVVRSSRSSRSSSVAPVVNDDRGRVVSASQNPTVRARSSRSSSVAPDTNDRGRVVSASQDPTVLAIEQAIAEIQRGASGGGTPELNEEASGLVQKKARDAKIPATESAPSLLQHVAAEPIPTSRVTFFPAPTSNAIDLLPSVFENAASASSSPRAHRSATRPHLDDAFEPEARPLVCCDEDDVLSALERASNKELSSSPPKFDHLESPELPSPRSVNASSPSTPYHYHGFLNASTPGDDSFVGFNDFEDQPLATSTPGGAHRIASTAGELPSITEITTPSSRGDYYGSRDTSFADSVLNSVPRKLAESPMLPDDLSASRWAVASDHSNTEDGSVRYKSTTTTGHKPARKPVQRFFSSPAQDSEDDYSGLNNSPQNTLPELDESHILSPTIGDNEYWNQSPLHQTFGVDSSPSSAGEISSAERRRSDREETPEFDGPPQPAIRLPKRGMLKHQRISSVTLDKRQRQYEERPWLENSTLSQQGDPETLERASTPTRNIDEELDQRINDLLLSLPQKVKLTASNLQKLNELSNKKTRQPKPWNMSQSSIPAPKSATSERSSGTPGHVRTASRRHQSIQGDIKCYHLHRNDEQPPMKLYVRLVGDSRLVCRVGGGWSDLEEYLKEWATHHGSKMRAVSESRLEIQDIPTYGGPAGQRTVRPTASNSSLPSFRSPTPTGSPSPRYNNSRPVSPAGRRNHSQRAVSPAFSVTAARQSLPPRAQSPAFRRSDSPMLLSHRGSESPALQGPTIPSTLGPSPIMRGGHNGTQHRQPITPTTNSFPVHRQELTPPSPPSRPTSSGSPLALRHTTSRLSFTESVGESERQPLGLAGPRSKSKKHMTPENVAWVEGMIGQVRKASSERYRGGFSSASERGGSVSGSNYGGSVYGEHEDEQQGGEGAGGWQRSNGAREMPESPEEARLPPRSRGGGGETRRVFLKRGDGRGRRVSGSGRPGSAGVGGRPGSAGVGERGGWPASSGVERGGGRPGSAAGYRPASAGVGAAVGRGLERSGRTSALG